MEQGKFEQREQLIREYFQCWVENLPERLSEIFSPGIIYSECFGPEYRGLGQIERWFRDWHLKGRVLEWRIKSFLHQGSRTAVEWYFRCDYDGVAGFDGVSLIDFDEGGRIYILKEFQSKAEHEFPFVKDEII